MTDKEVIAALEWFSKNREKMYSLELARIGTLAEAVRELAWALENQTKYLSAKMLPEDATRYFAIDAIAGEVVKEMTDET